MVGERDLARQRRRAAADQPGRREHVVGRAERALGDQAAAVCSPATEWMRVTSIASARGQRRQHAGEAPREHRLAGAGRAVHEEVVAAGGGDLDRRDHGVVAAHVATGPARVRPRPRRPAARPEAAPGRHGRPARRRPRRASRPRRPRARRRAPPRVRGAAGRRGAAARGGGRPRRSPASPRIGRGPRRPARALRRTRVSATASGDSWSLATRTTTASERSKLGPALRRYAGARLTVMRFCGNSKPRLTMAERTRSRASRTALSASPTTLNAGRPWRMSASTVTRREVTPSRANAVTRPSHQNAPSRWSSDTRSPAASTTTPIASKRSSGANGRSVSRQVGGAPCAGPGAA